MKHHEKISLGLPLNSQYIYIFFFSLLMSSWLGGSFWGLIVLQKIDFKTRPVPTFDQHNFPWLSRRNLRHFLDLRRRLGMGRDPFLSSSLLRGVNYYWGLSAGTSGATLPYHHISQCHDIHSQSLFTCCFGMFLIPFILLWLNHPPFNILQWRVIQQPVRDG